MVRGRGPGPRLVDGLRDLEEDVVEVGLGHLADADRLLVKVNVVEAVEAAAVRHHVAMDD